jgi:hypothetical protein
MAHFYKKEYRGLECEILPIDFRRFRIFRSFPYWKGTVVKLRLTARKVDKSRDMRLNTLPLKFKFPSNYLRDIYSHQKLPDDASEFIFDSQQIPSNGALEIWLDIPERGDAVKLADLEGNWKDWTWYTILGALIGMIVGALGGEVIRSILTSLGGQ